MNPTVVLTKDRHAEMVRRVLPDAALAFDLDGLTGGDCLIAYATGVIVPPGALRAFGRCYNFHGASPAFPGRDPHHWACYEGAAAFGATAHEMVERVDAGAIVATVLAGVEERRVQCYREVAEAALRVLFEMMAPRMAKAPVASTGEQWAGIRRSRADLLAMCDLRGLDEQEQARRRCAFAGFERAFA